MILTNKIAVVIKLNNGTRQENIVTPEQYHNLCVAAKHGKCVILEAWDICAGVCLSN